MEFKDYACNYSIITGCKKQKQNRQLHITEHMHTKCGVPQGVIISPLLLLHSRMICPQSPTLHQNLIFADISIITSYPDVYYFHNCLNGIFHHWLEELDGG